MQHSDKIFHDETAARKYLESVRWPEGPFCPFCGQFETVKALPAKGSMGPGWYHCRECRRKFTVRVGTLYERSKIPLHKWLFATFLMASSKKGISAHQLHRMLGITYKSAWFMAHRIRESMTDDNPTPMGGEGQDVEIDETYIGRLESGSTKQLYRDKETGKLRYKWKSGMSASRTIVTLVERNGRARSFHIGKFNMSTIREVIYTNADRASRLQTDDARWYRPIGKQFKGGHGRVNHTRHEYARGRDHTQTIEGYFSIFKRGMKGVYQHCGSQHLQRYLTEFDFRYSNRGISDAERTVIALKGIEGKRLTYRRPESGANS